MPKPLRAVQRRTLVNRALARTVPAATAAIHAALQSRYKALVRELRRGSLRKRLNKGLHGSNSRYTKIAGLDNPDVRALTRNAINHVLFLRKADDGDYDDADTWSDWIDDFGATVKSSLYPVVDGVYGAESRWWESHDARPGGVDPANIVDNYLARSGRQITDIADDTRDGVLDEVAIWYNSDEGLATLIDSLGGWFDEARAELIARTEASYIASEVSDNLYRQFGVEYFNVDVAHGNSPYPCEICSEQADNNPHSIDDEKPPFHPECLCGTVPATADGETFVFGGG